MGIKDLWTILTPFCDRKPLFELQGKTVAVDLSGWVCQAQCITEYHVQPGMYLRNLYFRTCCLLMLDVNVVFVLEGEAPTLKHKTIRARNVVQFKGARPRPKKDGPPPSLKGRSRFNHVLKRCEEMLRLMGLSCLTAAGEAEAMCAYLNEKGMVDGCISQDSDCFAYGAKIVYRNFSISQQGAHAASGGSVDVYNIDKAVQAIDFGRNKIIALALLCGSDYNEGVFGIGKDSAVKLFSSIADRDILERLRSWRTSGSLYEELEKECDKKKVCSQCGHVGMKATHTRSGCKQCRSHKGCNIAPVDNRRLEIKNEVAIRNKALEDPNFPDDSLVGEFLCRKDSVGQLNLSWKKPDALKFIAFTEKHLQWECIYSFEKIFPILTRWIILNPKMYDPKLDPVPNCIKKIRNPKGVASYEIIWDYKSMETRLTEVLSEDLDIVKLLSSIEPQHLVQKSFPDLVEAYNLSKVKPKKKRETKKRQKAKPKENTIEKYIVKTTKEDSGVPNEAAKITEEIVCDSDASFFGDEDADVDLSLIVGNIIGQGIPEVVHNKLKELCVLSEITNDVLDCKRSKINDVNGWQDSITHSSPIIKKRREKKISKTHSDLKITSPSIDRWTASDKQMETNESGPNLINNDVKTQHPNDVFENATINNLVHTAINPVYINSSNLNANQMNESITDSNNALNTSHFFGDVLHDDEDQFERTFNELRRDCLSDDDSEETSDNENDRFQPQMDDESEPEKALADGVTVFEESFESEYVPLVERLKRKQL